MELKKLVFQFAQKNNKNYPISWFENNSAGKNWLNTFLKRHSLICLRKPEATSSSRATSFNRSNVQSFFGPDQIYNLDETGNSTVHVPLKVLSLKEEKQVGSMTLGERGLNITVIAAVNAIGNHIPPMSIYSSF